VLRDPSGSAEVGAKGPAPEGAVAGRASRQSGKLSSAETGVSSELRARLMDAIREKLSARHLPNEIFAIPAVPRTLSGKKLEIPVKKILLGHDVKKAVNRDSMGNPESIDWFVDFTEARGNS